jgi:hypothetical protein
MISITKNPSILINGHKSKWFPAHQPITFEVQRMDATVIQKYRTGNEVHFKFNTYIPSSVKAGQKLNYIQGTTTKTLTVKAIDGAILKFEFIASLNLIGGTNGYVIFTDAYTSYFIETKVFYIKSTAYEEIGTLKNKTNNSGVAKISVQELLSTKCINQNNFIYNVINQAQTGEGTKFNIQIREVINGVAGNYTSMVDDNVLYFTNSSNQIQDKYGYNMGSYVPTYDNARTDKAKFQSVFKRPTYFVGYPFSLNFIYSDNMTNSQLTRKEQTKDINGNIIANTSDNLNIAFRFTANRLMLKQGYTSNVKTVDIWIDAGAPTFVPVIPKYTGNTYSVGNTFDVGFKINETYIRGIQNYTKSLYE